MKIEPDEETGRPPIQGVGEVIDVHENGLITVRMANGYEVDAHLDKTLKRAGAEFCAGQQLQLEFSAYDMAQARVLGEA